jgi:endonuclease III
VTTTVNLGRARILVGRLSRAFDDRSGLLGEVGDLIEHQIPEGVAKLSVEHARFLFFVVSNDHGIKSSHLYSKAKQLFVQNPEIFNPSFVLRQFGTPYDRRLIELTGERLGTRYPKETAKGWFINSALIREHFEGEPLNLLRFSGAAKDLFSAIRRFRGYGPKTGGILLRAIVGVGFAKVTGLDEVLLPVDVHDTRISFLTRVLRNTGSKDLPGPQELAKYVKKVQMVLKTACDRERESWLNVDRALWLIGSRGCSRGRCELCPISDLCQVGSARTKSGSYCSEKAR